MRPATIEILSQRYIRRIHKYLFNTIGILADGLADLAVHLFFVLLGGELDEKIASIHPRYAA